MIRSFRDEETEKVRPATTSCWLPHDIQQTARRKLRVLNNVQSLDDLRALPSNRLEALKGDLKGQHSIRINDQWRLCFVWKNCDAHDVEIADYH